MLYSVKHDIQNERRDGYKGQQPFVRRHLRLIKTSLRGSDFVRSLFRTFQSTFVLTDINQKLADRAVFINRTEFLSFRSRIVDYGPDVYTHKRYDCNSFGSEKTAAKKSYEWYELIEKLCAAATVYANELLLLEIYLYERIVKITLENYFAVRSDETRVVFKSRPSSHPVRSDGPPPTRCLCSA